MFGHKPFYALSTALISVAYIALHTAPSTAYAASEPNAEQSSERPLGILIAPFPKMNSSDVPDVHATSGINQPIQERVISPSPPLGVLLKPLADGDHAKTASPLSRISNEQILASPTASIGIGSAASPDRPLGLLMDQSSFSVLPQPNSDTASPIAAQPTAALKYVAPTPNWNQQGQTSSRPLGTLLKRGSFNPVPLPPRQPNVTGISEQLYQTPPIPKPPSTQDKSSTEEPAVNFSADEMGFEQETGIVTAQGNVEIVYHQRRLSADKVTYNRNNNHVVAEGNVVIVEPTSETIYGDKIEISGDLRDGFILNIGIILQDRSRIAGAAGSRTGGRHTEIRNAVYSPCSLCKDDPDRPPVWQIKAVKVKHDKTAKVVEYQDAWLEFFGFPVFYTPYFRHPDPTVKRKSGFLYPTFGNSSDLGSIFQVPYFFNISPHEDATLTPILMTSADPVLSGEYRNRSKKGAIDVSGSITSNSDDTNDFNTENGRFGIRGHIQSKGRFDVNRSWRWGFDGNWTTDDTYMRRYGFGAPSSLESRLYAESFKNRSYFSVNALTYQGLQVEDNSDEIPLILPLVDFNYVGNKDRLGGSTNFDFNFLTLTREEGTDTRRLSARSVWQRPFVGVLGDVYNISLGLNTDLYHVNGLNRGGNQSQYDGFSYRITPEAAFEWRMPFVKSDGNISQVIEPIASFMWSPYGGNSNKIPNEDSIELEFDDTNLFRTNRFSGLDRVEGGPRLIYGLKWGAYGSEGGKTNVFVGQSWRPKNDDTYASGSGLEDNFSDIVARMDVSPGPHLKASYRTRLSVDNLSPNRNEFALSAGIPAFRLSSNYVFLDNQTDSEFSGREELTMSANSQMDRFWSSGFNATRDMDAGEMRTAGMFLTYEDECVVLTTRLNRTFFEDRDLEPTDSITFNLILKTIGEVNTSASLSP